MRLSMSSPNPYCAHTTRDLTSMRLPTHGVFDNVSLKSFDGMGWDSKKVC